MRNCRGLRLSRGFALGTALACAAFLALPVHAAGPSFSFSQSASLGEDASATAAERESLRGGFTARPLDGSVIRAVEKYVNPSSNEIALSVGMYPFNPYYLGFEGSASYTYYFNESWAWEVVHATYVFPVNKDLTNELADLGFTPPTLNRLNYLVTSNAEYVFAYGKALFFKDFIRYFRASALAGVGLAGAVLDSKFAITQGLKFEFYVASSLSWRLEFRNAFTISLGNKSSGTTSTGSSTYPSFHLGVGIGL